MAKRDATAKLWSDVNTAAIDAAVTLWWRWPVLLSAGLPLKDAAELERMVSEKVRAAAAGMAAAQAEMIQIAAKAVAGKNTADAPTRVVAAAVTPAFRTVKANAKRLQKRRKSSRKSRAVVRRVP
jgi:hypothetical protein